MGLGFYLSEDLEFLQLDGCYQFRRIALNDRGEQTSSELLVEVSEQEVGAIVRMLPRLLERHVKKGLFAEPEPRAFYFKDSSYKADVVRVEGQSMVERRDEPTYSDRVRDAWQRF